MYSNLLLLCAGFLLHVPLNFWKSGEMFSHEFWWKQMCLRQRQVFREVCFSSVLCLWDCTDNITKTNWQLLTPQTFIYLKIGTVQGPGRIIYYPFSEIYCVFIYSLLANHFFTAIWRTAAGIGREFILSVQWNHQENFSCGADTSQSELCFWIEISNSVTHCERNQAVLRW